jgi:hypothetical protein
MKPLQIDPEAILNGKRIKEPLLFVDVGAHKGDFRRDFDPIFHKKKRIWVGIDPCFYSGVLEYDFFVEKAISDVETEKTQLFYEYIEPGCNSLLKMKTKHIVHFHNERKPGKWFVPRRIEKLTKRRKVKVDSLEHVLDTLKLPPWSNKSIELEALVKKSDIHYLKVDTQGSDIKVVRSLGKYIKKVHFVKMESAVSVTLYKGQQNLAQDIKDMASLGFEPAYLLDHDTEADIIFYNKEFYYVQGRTLRYV